MNAFGSTNEGLFLSVCLSANRATFERWRRVTMRKSRMELDSIRFGKSGL